MKLGAAAGVSVPHAGLHEFPAALSVHVTPAFAVSYCTFAVSVTGAAPGAIVVNVFSKRTTIAGAPMVNVVSAVTAVFVGAVTVSTIEFGVGGVIGAVYVSEVTVV